MFNVFVPSRPNRAGRIFGAFLSPLVLGLCFSFASGMGTAGEPNAAEPARPIPEIKWDTTLRHFQFDADKFIGQRLTVKCPPAAVDQPLDGVFGTDVYPSEAPICLAALHAGKLTRTGGVVTLQLCAGASEYQGSRRNDVESADLPGTPRCFVFVDGKDSDEVKRAHLEQIPRIDWDTKFTATGFAHRHLVGQRFTFRCGAAPVDRKARLVYGTDHYDFASRICYAALHAGRITKEGGVFTVQIDRGVPRLVGSIRNGLETNSKRGGDRSLSFVDNPVANTP